MIYENIEAPPYAPRHVQRIFKQKEDDEWQHKHHCTSHTTNEDIQNQCHPDFSGVFHDCTQNPAGDMGTRRTKS
jgi:hypothetical protein